MLSFNINRGGDNISFPRTGRQGKYPNTTVGYDFHLMLHP